MSALQSTISETQSAITRPALWKQRPGTLIHCVSIDKSLHNIGSQLEQT